MNSQSIAYIHTDVDEDVDYGYRCGKSSEWLRRHFRGILIGCGGYTPATASTAIAQGAFEPAGFGRFLLANPDLVSRVRHGLLFKKYNRRVFENLR